MASRRRSLLGSPTVQTLLVFLGVFGLVRLIPGLADHFVLHRPFTRPWTLVTSIYAHLGVAHLVGNALILAIVGTALERSTTNLAYHTYFVGAGILSGLFQFLIPESVGVLVWLANLVTLGLFDLSHPGAAPALGASGAILAVAGYVLAGNGLSQGILRKVPAAVQWGIVLALAVGVTVWLSGPGVANIAHFFGIFVGLVAGAVGLLPERERTGNASY